MNDDSRDEFIQWAKASAHRLAGADVGPGEDLAVLADLVGAARVVGLGESWHPVHEFLAINFRITRYLIEQLGFTGVLLEASLSTSQLLDDYVNGRSDDPRELVVSSPWDNQEMFTFLEWVRAYNASVPAERRVRVFGLDAYILIMEDTKAPGRAVEAVVAYLRHVDPDYQPPHLDTIRRVFADFTVTASIDERRRANFEYVGTLDPETVSELQTAFAGMLQRLEDRRAEYSSLGPVEDYEWALHRATVASQGLRMYLTHAESVGDGLVLRSEAMAANASWAVDQLGPGARVVMLATGVNVARSPWTYAGADTQLPSVGDLLAERYEYFGLTMTFGSGEFSPPNPITGTTVVPDAAADSVDLALAAVGAPYLLVDLRGRTAPAPPSGWLAAPHPLRPMQNVAAPTAYYFPEAIDALVYVDRIHGHEPRRH